MDIFTNLSLQKHDAKHLKSGMDKLIDELGGHPSLSSDEQQAFHELKEALENASDDFE